MRPYSELPVWLADILAIQIASLTIRITIHAVYNQHHPIFSPLFNSLYPLAIISSAVEPLH